MKRYLFICFMLCCSLTFSFGSMSGTYTIGGNNPDFTTISQAVNTLKSGISGAVILNIRSGTYTDMINIIQNIPGISVTNTVTFQSESANSSDVTIIGPNNYVLSTGSSRLIFKDLTLKGTCFMSYCAYNILKNIVFLNNANNSLNISFCQYCQVLNCKIYTRVELANGGNNIIANNFFYGNWFRNAYSDQTAIVFNSFTSDPTAYFRNVSSYSSIENNILPVTFINEIITSVVRFNDYPFGNCYNSDIYALFIDPQYKSPTDLHATNMQLYGKANLSSINYDIDNRPRTNPSSIGANEVCISEDTLNVFCGDSITLALCGLPTVGNFTWHPSNGLNDNHIARPKLATNFSQWFFVTDSVSGFSDSVFIKIHNFTVNLPDEVTSDYCGASVLLYSFYNESAIYQWLPTDSLSNPNSYSTYANPSVTTSYTLTATIPGCGVYSDTVKIIVSSFPHASLRLGINVFNKVCLINTSTCADFYKWDFGDSTTSNEVSPCHIYSHTGFFTVVLRAFNDDKSSTFSGMLVVDTIVFISVPEITDIKNEIKIYPNPAKNQFTISTNNEDDSILDIYNSCGILVYQTRLKDKKEHLINADLSKGIYLVKIQSNNTLSSKILIID